MTASIDMHSLFCMMYYTHICLKCNGLHAAQSILGQFYSGQLRFFRQLCTAAKVETVSQLAHKTLAEGKCIVIGLQSTGMGSTEQAVSDYALAPISWPICFTSSSGRSCVLVRRPKL